MKKIYGVIGDPIAHSMSPIMHNDSFKRYSINADYLAFHVKQEALHDAVKGFKAIQLAGFNVTVPHKTTIMAYLDEIDPLAQAIGAVNTVVNDEGRFIGYNTDGSGFLEGLKKEIPTLKNQKMLLIGAGGAARAIYYTMAHAGVQTIDIANRTAEKAEYLVQNCPYPVDSAVLSIENAERKLAEYDLIVQTTSIGMHPDTERTPICLDGIKKDAFVSDIIYTPLETKFLREAKQNGARTQNGISMFVYQGALAFEKWTGILPDTDSMESIVLKQLGGKTC
ncbi:shikimate dehydrogenase [Bacillus tuaregi]|uniref:shikimate dehydrogenase n=1 Tax=Bacillus tuaregi TaxID=1816695 RepID=UPI0008F8E3C5|nr:shikimate dehydrogenase [Bacillus tuaregi]